MTHTPPIPVTCAHRPTVGGLVAPFVNVRLADGGVDFRSSHQATYTQCWRQNLCQTCGGRLARTSVLFGGPRQLYHHRFDEPALCLPCAVYASQACPMVAGRLPTYATRDRLAEGPRGQVCPDGCGCGGYTDADPGAGDPGGDPAHPWYAAYVRTGRWRLTTHQTQVRCYDEGCLHTRTLISGCELVDPPVRVVLVSTPAAGRVWTPVDAATLPTVCPPW